MGFLEKLLNKLKGPSSSPGEESIHVTKDAVWVYLKCDRCGEKLALRLRKSSEIQREEAGTQDYQMFINKTVIGNECFNRMQLRLEFDGMYKVMNKRLQNGTFISKNEYESGA